jgi:alcohol dehydrogenase, propanol-preferring
MMRAAVLHTPRPVTDDPLILGDVETPSAAATDVVIDVHACGVCRTDLQLCEGDLVAKRLPIIPGHQVVGTVSAVGADVTDLHVGDRVGVAWIASACGRCRFCSSGRENLCVDAAFTGWDVDGGYAQSMRARHDFVYRLPDGYDDVSVAPLLCGGVIGYRCLRVAGAASGMRIGLYGFGASATVVIQVARHWGCDVYVVTRSVTEQQRALALGAVWAGPYETRPPVPLDAAITFAPSGDVVVAALAAIDRGGVVVVNAIHLDRIPEFDYGLLWWERSLRSVANVTRADVKELLALAPKIPIITHTDRYPLARVNDALRDLAKGRVRGAAVVDMTTVLVATDG